MTEEIIKKKILIVDDEAGFLVLLRSCLEGEGFEVLEGSNGMEALNIVKQRTPDLVILDRMMPRMDGIKACALIKSDKRFSRIPVIMFTASAEKSDVKLSEQAGADAFMNKPLNCVELVKKIKELLARP